MGVSVAVVGPSGGGKTTSHMINMDGTVDLNPEKYTGMNPKTHFIINTDCKQLPCHHTCGIERTRIIPKLKNWKILEKSFSM